MQTIERIKTEEKLSSLQRKKGAIIFGALQRELRAGTPIAYKVVESVDREERDETVEVVNEDGEVEKINTKKAFNVEKTKWAFGKLAGIAPAVDSRGLHGIGYKIETDDGDVVTVPKDSVITVEMHDHIKYHPTLLVVYRDDEPVMVVMYTWDSVYLPCSILAEQVDNILDNEFYEYILDSKDSYEVSDDWDLTIKFQDARKNEHSFGPMKCTLFQNSDCRGCLSRLIDWSDASWSQIRQIVKSITGRGTMYADGNFVIRRAVSRELFIRFVEVDRWAKMRDSKYLLSLTEAILEYQESQGVGVPDFQLGTLVDTIKDKLKTENAALKKSGDEVEMESFKERKKQIMANIKQIKPYSELDVEEVDSASEGDEEENNE